MDSRLHTWDADLQDVVNAVEIPARWTQAPTPPGPLPIQARIHWSEDGVEVIDTVARGWTRQALHVELVDRRHQGNAVWLSPSDVRRRPHS